MSYATDRYEEAMINIMRNSGITAKTPYLALYLSAPNDDGTGGTEISYTGYARKAVTFTAPAEEGTSLEMHNNADISFYEAQTSVGTVTHVCLFDALTGGNMWLYGQLETPLVVQQGVSPVFRAGSVKWSWSGRLNTYYRTAVMNAMRGTAVNAFTPYLGLLDSSKEELSGTGYARQTQTGLFSAPQQVSGMAQTSNANEITFPQAESGWGTAAYIGIFDALTGGNRYAEIPFDSNQTYNIVAGTVFGFHAGDLKFSID